MSCIRYVRRQSFRFVDGWRHRFKRRTQISPKLIDADADDICYWSVLIKTTNDDDGRRWSHHQEIVESRLSKLVTGGRLAPKTGGIWEAGPEIGGIWKVKTPATPLARLRFERVT